MSNVTLAGNPIDVAGRFPQIGDQLTELTLVNNELGDVNLNTFAGQRKVLNIFQVSTLVFAPPPCVNSTKKPQHWLTPLYFAFPLTCLLRKSVSVAQKASTRYKPFPRSATTSYTKPSALTLHLALSPA